MLQFIVGKYVAFVKSSPAVLSLHSMAVMQNQHLALSLVVITNEAVQLGM